MLGLCLIGGTTEIGLYGDSIPAFIRANTNKSISEAMFSEVFFDAELL